MNKTYINPTIHVVNIKLTATVCVPSVTFGDGEYSGPMHAKEDLANENFDDEDID